MDNQPHHNDIARQLANATSASSTADLAASEVVVDVVLFDSERDSIPKPWRGTMGSLFGSRHEIREQKAGTRAFSAVTYKLNCSRGNAGVESVTAAVFDFDHRSELEFRQVVDRLHGYATVVYSSSRDRLDGPDDRRFRVVLPLSRPVTPSEWSAVRAEILAELGVPADEAASDPARLWYLPACPAARSADAFISFARGQLLEPDHFLTAHRAAVTIPGVGPLRKPATTCADLVVRLKRLRNKDHRALMELVASGLPFAESGTRNDTLYRILSIAAFAARDTTPDVLVEFVGPSIAAMAAADPVEPLTIEVARSMAERAVKNAQESRGRLFERGDDVELAETVIADVGANTDLVHAEGSFFRYDADSGIYAPVPRERMSCQIQSYAGSLVNGKDGTYVLRLSRGMVAGALGLAADQVASPEFFDRAPAGLAFSNGFVSVTDRGATLEPHSASHRTRSVLPFPFDEAAKCDRFRQFLAEIFRDDRDAAAKIAVIQEFTGASLLGIATRYARALVLLGTGRNGKSTLIDVVLSLFPASARSAIPPQSFESDYHRALLAGKLINSVAELPRADILKGEAFKALVAGDEVTARQIYCPPITFRAKAGHIMAANALPGSDDLSVAFWERMLIVTFNRFFDQGERDKNLAATIIATELPGVAVWAIEGAARLLGRGDSGAYTEPDSHGVAMAEWKTRADQVRQFVDERTTPTTDPQRRVQASTLYVAYKTWAEENGHRVMANPTFGERLKALGVRRVKPHSVAYYELELIPMPRGPGSTIRSPFPRGLSVPDQRGSPTPSASHPPDPPEADIGLPLGSSSPLLPS